MPEGNTERRSWGIWGWILGIGAVLGGGFLLVRSLINNGFYDGTQSWLGGALTDYDPIKAPKDYVGSGTLTYKGQSFDSTFLSGYQEAKFTYDGSKELHYWKRGAGTDGAIDPAKPTYVMYHGVQGHWGEPFRLQQLGALPKDANIIAVTMPGWGKSDGPQNPAQFEQANEALISHLFGNGADKLGLDPTRTSAIGHSQGAYFAANFARQVRENSRLSDLHGLSMITPYTTSKEAVSAMSEKAAGETIGKFFASIFGAAGHDMSNLDELTKLKNANTNLHLVTARSDIVVPPAQQQQVASKARTLGLNPNVTSVSTDHLSPLFAQHISDMTGPNGALNPDATQAPTGPSAPLSPPPSPGQERGVGGRTME